MVIVYSNPNHYDKRSFSYKNLLKLNRLPDLFLTFQFLSKL
ncbi:hypothetical protein CYK57_01363 [Actinobacillus pleuropneumoniae]|nr:hypothetical protein CYK57_01363 [Actinobacillus pleuropneumoniae]